jgi:hypothetical protein
LALAPGMLPHALFLATQQEFQVLLQATASASASAAASAEALQAHAARVQRMTQLHGLLAGHVGAMIAGGAPIPPFPPLPPALQLQHLQASAAAADAAAAAATRGVTSYAAALAPSGAASGRGLAIGWGQQAQAQTQAQQTQQQAPTPELVNLSPSQARAAQAAAGQAVRYPDLVNLSPSQARAAALGVRPTPRALTLASILSGPPPATLGGRRMSRADVLATSRYFFNQLKDGAWRRGAGSPWRGALSLHPARPRPRATCNLAPPPSRCRAWTLKRRAASWAARCSAWTGC